MIQKTVLLIDDEQGFLEPLADALQSENYRVLKATTAEDALHILAGEKIHLVTVDIMMAPGRSFEGKINSHETGIILCEKITQQYPNIDVFCLSVVSDEEIIKRIQSFGVKFLRKGETPLRTVLNMMRSRLTGIAYSTEKPWYKE